MFELFADKNNLTVLKKELITSGSSNVYTVKFEFSDDWKGFTKTVVFKVGDVSSTVILDEETKECKIPAKALLKSKRPLMIGVYGQLDTETILPTVWANVGIIAPGTEAKDDIIPPPEPSVYDQLISEINKKGDALDYDGLDLKLLSNGNIISTVPIIGGGGDVTTGVLSFNGRTGHVEPKKGDYTAEMVGADSAGSAESVKEELTKSIEAVDLKAESALSQIDDKLSTSGGTVTGTIEFSAQNEEVQTYVQDDGQTTKSQEKLSISNTNISSTGDLNLDTGSAKVTFTNPTEGLTVLSGVQAADEDKTSAPNLGQMEQHVQSAINSALNNLELPEIIDRSVWVTWAGYDISLFTKDSTNTSSFGEFVGAKPKVTPENSKEYGLVLVNNKLYWTTFKITAISEDTQSADMVFLQDPILIGPTDGGGGSGTSNLSDAPLGVNFYEHVPKKDDYINFPVQNIHGALPVADGPLTGIVYNTEGIWICYCKVSDNYKPGYWAAMTQVIGIPIGIDLNNYYNKAEIDEKIAQFGSGIAPGILLYGSVVDPIVKNQSTTVTENFFIGPIPQVNDAGYGLLEQAKKLYRVAYHVSSISSDNLFTIVYDSEPELIGPSEGDNNELITIKDTDVTNASQLPEESCCIHAINCEIGFSFNDDIIYVARLGSMVVIYTINGDMITLNVDSDTGNLSVDSSGIDRWAKESDVYNKSQVDQKIADIELTPGEDGITPHIGENGNWFIGDTDTGIAAQGEDGLSALVLNATFTSTPATNTDYLINRTWLNREPVSREVISGTVTDDKNVVFWVVGKMIQTATSPYTAKFSTVTKLNGNNGAKGDKGDNGTTFTPSVDTDGNLSWSNNGGLNNPGTVNIKGPVGVEGQEALVYGTIYQLSAPLEVSDQTYTLSTDITKYNRTPETGESVIIVCKFENRSWITVGTVEEILETESNANVPVTLTSFVETTGEKGEAGQGGSGTGATDHNELTNRDMANQHPIEAITGLQEILDTIPVPITAEELDKILV